MPPLRRRTPAGRAIAATQECPRFGRNLGAWIDLRVFAEDLDDRPGAIMYAVVLFFHILGAVLFVGNIIVTAMWKARADRTGDLATIAFANRLVAATDRVFTVPGAILIALTGYTMAARRPWPLHGLPWLEYGQGLFWLTVLIYLIVLIPVQRRMLAVVDAARAGTLPPEYGALSKRWAMWGGIATLLPLIILYMMVTKP